MLSSIPPRPGIIFPLSFMLALLFNTDSTKSPIAAEAAVARPKKKPSIPST